MHATMLRTLCAVAVLATAPLAAHADRFADPLAPASQEQTGALTREQVREELSNWTAAGMMSLPGEITETPEILEARQTFNELQAEVLTAEYQAAERQIQALASEPAEPLS